MKRATPISFAPPFAAAVNILFPAPTTSLNVHNSATPTAMETACVPAKSNTYSIAEPITFDCCGFTGNIVGAVADIAKPIYLAFSLTFNVFATHTFALSTGDNCCPCVVVVCCNVWRDTFPNVGVRSLLNVN